MFDVIVDYIKEFHVIVRDFSKIDSLVGALKYGTYYIKERVTVALWQKGITKSVSYMTAKINEILGFKVNSNQSNTIEAKISSIENIKDAKCLNDLDIKAVISSIEKLKGKMNNISGIDAAPLFAYFRKLVEFDSKALFELDDLTLEDMDYILTMMTDKDNMEVN